METEGAPKSVAGILGGGDEMASGQLCGPCSAAQARGPGTHLLRSDPHSPVVVKPTESCLGAGPESRKLSVRVLPWAAVPFQPSPPRRGR